MTYPSMFRLRQSFQGPTVDDVPTAVREALGALNLETRIRPGETVAVAVGSRGITNIDLIVSAAVHVLKTLGLRPFIVPAMGSHGGATAEGQKDVLRHLGITEATAGCPLRSSMEAVQIGGALDLPVFLDRNASEADHIVFVSRVKPHTDFTADIESGLHKMMAMGIGKQIGARQYHAAAIQHGYATVIKEVAQEVLRQAPVLCGLAIVENGNDQTAKVTAVLPAEFEAAERALLAEAKAWMARLPFDPIDLLIIDEMGKNISGTGMDTNVTGYPYVQKAGERPHVRRIFVRELRPESCGNAIGIGMADFTTARLASSIDRHATYVNALTASAPEAARVPVYFDTDREAVEAALGTIGLTPPERTRVVRIKSTLLLAEMEASEALLAEARANPHVTVLADLVEMRFEADGNLAPLVLGNGA